MEAVRYDLILLSQVSRLKLQLSVVVEPDNLSVSEVVHIECVEVASDMLHLSWNSALWSVLEWPMPTGQNLSLKLDLSHHFGAIMLSVSIVLHGLLTLHNILKHCLDLVDRIVPTFYLELLDHELLCFIGDTGLVQKSLSEQTGEPSNEYITTMEAAEQPDDGIQSLLNFVIGE